MSAFHDEPSRSFRIPGWFVVIALIGAGYYFFQHYNIAGLDQISVYPKDGRTEQASYDTSFVGLNDNLAPYSASELGFGSLGPAPLAADHSFPAYGSAQADRTFTAKREPFNERGNASVPVDGNSFTSLRNTTNLGAPSVVRPRVRNIRIASWALSGFTPSKLADSQARRNLVRVIRQFDLIALQQITSQERDLIPRLVDAANEGSGRFEYIIGDQTGPRDRQEQLAFIFDTARIRADRRQTYTLADPDQNLLYDPLVAWFQTAELPTEDAWTFSLVNVRIDLGRAPIEVAALSNVLSAVKADGRREDDVVMAGLFQADDAYLLPSIAGTDVRAAVRSVPTDIFGRNQTSNVLMDVQMTSEYIGRGGALDFLRVYNLSAAEAETLTSHLPVFAEFTAHEGGEL
jgi:hypothetical protein